MTMRLFLVRHPAPMIAPGICYGSTDLAIAPNELARVVAALSGTLPGGLPLFSSPLQRCANLAAALAGNLESTSFTDVTIDARLAELDFGAWEMQPWDAIPRAEIDAWAADVVHYRPGGGESVLAMAARVRDWHADLLRLNLASAIVVCHAGTMRLLLACHGGLSLHDMALQAASKQHGIGYGEVVIVER
jgi:alpha-ribazole phosphatase